MSNRFDICTPRPKKDGGSYWVKIGTAWQNEKGTQLVFDALPIPDAEGRCVANLFEPKPRDGAQQGGQQRQQSGGNNRFATDDSIPGWDD